jgi:hypothetical protein
LVIREEKSLATEVTENTEKAEREGRGKREE